VAETWVEVVARATGVDVANQPERLRQIVLTIMDGVNASQPVDVIARTVAPLLDNPGRAPLIYVIVEDWQRRDQAIVGELPEEVEAWLASRGDEPPYH
jgi:hypothetical protein